MNAASSRKGCSWRMRRRTRRARAEDPLWYKDAIIYQLHVKAFYDSNGDGIGDFPGLTEKLDYIKDLGVNTIWLLPFYPSPLRDDGYDIADYHGIHPDYGTRADFRHFVREAHRRGLKIVTELVINHTSDAHPWFQAARQAPPGSAQARLLRVERHRPEMAGDADHLHRYREVQLDLGPGGEGATTGTASSRTSPISISRTPTSCGP